MDSFIRELFNDGTEDSIKMAKSLMARQRFFSPVVVRGEEDKGVRIWGYGKMAYQELLSLVLNPDYGDITDVEEGTDLVLTYGKPAGAQFPQTTLTPADVPPRWLKLRKQSKPIWKLFLMSILSLIVRHQLRSKRCWTASSLAKRTQKRTLPKPPNILAVKEMMLTLRSTSYLAKPHSHGGVRPSTFLFRRYYGFEKVKTGRLSIEEMRKMINKKLVLISLII